MSTTLWGGKASIKKFNKDQLKGVKMHLLRRVDETDSDSFTSKGGSTTSERGSTEFPGTYGQNTKATNGNNDAKSSSKLRIIKSQSTMLRLGHTKAPIKSTMLSLRSTKTPSKSTMSPLGSTKTPRKSTMSPSVSSKAPTKSIQSPSGSTKAPF